MEKKLRRPKPDEWLAIKCLQLLLGPFAVASSELGGQTSPMAPLVLPALSGIRKHLERTDLFDAHVGEAGDEGYVHEIEIMMNEYRKAMLAMYTKRFRALEESELKWVSFLDTRVAKRMSHRSPTDTPSACKEVVKAMVDLARDNLPSEDCQTSTPIPVQTDQQVRLSMYDHTFGPDEVLAHPTKLEEDCSKVFGGCYNSEKCHKSICMVACQHLQLS
ncbi:hypothetical protein Pcac1_g7677 [Phytophthora cactorum]|nr:hypothetical protein Pcac1_g7677 [Phytophthora cactorum]KAG2823796.1 hypothetical protein PC111_g10082 [Phytophthora cactorum]KAG2829865.1 hypothetical protein PC112_g7916 [Phytophthora cactorum]KAG2856460.1 hypothetical protein PC113_g11552 [Phytophthora cactorum]KAG2910098.1 hypothetical protein PC115_g13035 [Phytophthora cactorum]